MTRSSIYIGVGAFVLAMMMSVGIDPLGWNIGTSSISLGGTTALAQVKIELPDPADVVESLVDSQNADDEDDDDDDEPSANKDDDDN
jgi:hypothetical protein